MSNIATLSLKLQTDVAGWSSGLGAAQNDVEKFYASVGEKARGFASPLTGLAGQAASVGKSFAGLASSALAPLSGVASGLGTVAGAAGAAALAVAGIGLAAGVAGAAAAGAVASVASAGMDRIDALGDAAARIGVTTEALSELRYAANLTGSKAEDLDAALEKLNANLGDSATKATPTSEALKRLGLDAKTLAAQSADLSFAQIVKAFESIPNAADRASLAMDIFGKGGVKIINTLGSGSGQLEKLAEEARRLGVSVSQVDAAKIGAAKDAMDRAGSAIEGIGNTVAIKLAPFVEVAANKVADFFASFDNSGMVEGVIDGFISGLASVANGANLVRAGFIELFAEIVGGSQQALGTIGGLGMALSSIDPALATMGAVAVAASVAIGNSADALHASAARVAAQDPGKALISSYEAVKGQAKAAGEEIAKSVREGLGAKPTMDPMAKSIADVSDKLKEQIATFGKSSAAVERYKLAQAGATAEQLAQVDAQVKQLEGLEKTKKAEEEAKGFAKSLKDKIKTPEEKFSAEMEKISTALASGLITKAEAQSARVAALKESEKGTEGKFAGAVDFASTEARSTILRAMSGRGGMNDLTKIQQEALAVQKDQQISLRTIAKNTGQQPQPARDI